MNKDCGPTSLKERYAILDILRGTALLGIALANYPEFALWTFLDEEAQALLSTAGMDPVVKYLQYLFIDGKFYTIFSILFGIGFSLILSRHSVNLFLRRMLILLVIGFLHMMFIWSGDILLLYATGGLLLPLFIKMSDKGLLTAAIFLILLPIGIDGIQELFHLDFSAPFYQAWWDHATSQGIYEENFATWLRDAKSYPEVFSFLIQGAFERVWEFVEGNRLPKVIGLFIIGYYIGKHKWYSKLDKMPLKKVFAWSLGTGLPLSALYAWSATNGKPWGITMHSLLYAVSVIPLALSYMTGICMLYLRYKESKMLMSLSYPGRMALTCYITQSIIGAFLFYGIGLGYGTRIGLVWIEAVALAVFVIQIFLCRLWLQYFRFGPLEWVWRILTYMKYFPMIEHTQQKK